MGIIVEAILTVVAWKRGWKAWALLPLGIGIGIAFVAGFAIGISGNDDFPMEAFVIVDIGIIIAQIVMIAKPRHPQLNNAGFDNYRKEYCPACGNPISINWNNCPKCGEPIKYARNY